MSAQAPICHIPPVTTTTQPGPVNLPSIPPAQPNLASLAATVNAMRQVIMILVGDQGAQGRPGANGKDANAKGQWSETKRVTQTVKVYQNNDPSTGNFVEVQQINQLVMGNKATGQTWTWNR
jgi:hypothetical protein